MRQLHRSVVLKRELCTKAKLSIFRSVYVPILTYGHECWIMNEKVRSRVQAAEMGFLRRISGLILLDKVKSADIRESLNIESLLLRLERSQLRWYGHVTRMPQERTAKKLLCSTPIGRRPRGRPRTRWRDYVEDLSWSRLGIPAEHLSFVAEDRDAWRLQLELLPPRPPKDKRVQKIDWLIDWLWKKRNSNSTSWRICERIQIQSNLPVTSIRTSVATHQPPLLIPYLVSQIVIIMRLKQEIFLSTVGLASCNLFKIFSLKKCVK